MTWYQANPISSNSSGEMASSCLSMFFRVDLKNPSREQERAHFLTSSLSKKCDWGGHVLYPPPPLYQHSVHVCNGVAAASSPRLPCEKRKWKNSFYGRTLNCDCQCPRSQKKRRPCHFSWKECFFQSSLPVVWVKEKLWILLFGVAVQIRLMPCTRLPMEREARCAHQTSHSDTVRAAGSYLRDEARGSLTQRLSPYYKTIAELKETHKRERCTQTQL